MENEDHRPVHVGRRDFIKTTTLASVAGTLPGASILAQDAQAPAKPRRTGKARKILFINEAPATYEKLVQSIKAIKEFDFTVTPVQVSFKSPEDIGKAFQGQDADILLMILPRVTTVSGNIAAAMGNVNIPVILLPVNLDLIMLEADLAAAFRIRGTNAMVANSESHVVDLLKIVATPGILEGKKALIFGRPFDSTSVPARNLSEEYIYNRTGLRLQYRPISELEELLKSVDEAKAVKEMERWKKEAVKIVEPPDKSILDSSKMYVLLRSVVEKEALSAISVDCLSFSFSNVPPLPLPCLAFTRLRDEGFTVPCEADVCGLLGSMVFQEISQRPSYFCNTSSVDMQKSIAVLRHCVAPLKLMGRNAPPLAYNLRDYHGLGRGVTPEVEFPVGIDVTMGGFSKDLKNFVVWPGRTQSRVKDTDRPSFEKAPAAYARMRRYCSNHLAVKITDMDRFLQNIAGCHHVMVAGSYGNAIRNEMIRLGVNIVGPADLSAPA